MKDFSVDDFYKRLSKGRCNPCKYSRAISSNGGYTFLGCFCEPYKGKSVSEIKLCPIKEGEDNG